MNVRLFSTRKRPFHLGPFPCEKLLREDQSVDSSDVPPMIPVSFKSRTSPQSLVNAMADYQAMLDAIRDGLINKEIANCPKDLIERANHIKSFAYFQDAPMAGISVFDKKMLLDKPIRNPVMMRAGVEHLKSTHNLALLQKDYDDSHIKVLVHEYAPQ